MSALIVDVVSLIAEKQATEIRGILLEAISPSWSYCFRRATYDDESCKDALSFEGLSSEKLVSSILSQTVSGSDDNLTVILTASPIDSKLRLRFYPDRHVILVSTWRLSDQFPSQFSAALIYAAIAAYAQGVSDPHPPELSLECIYTAHKYDKTVDFNICSGCLAKLRTMASFVSHELASIRLAKERQRNLVFLQHGIRTNAPWYDEVRKCLTSHSLTPITYRYGYLSIPRFVLNGIFGKKIKQDFVREYRITRETNPYCRISVIAHSYGTLALAQALKDNADIKIDKIIFVNSIVPRDFNWGVLGDRGQFRQLLNECGGNDIWPIIASKFVPGAGSSGSRGFLFDTSRVMNTFYRNARHSDLLNARQCKEVWAPFLMDGPGHEKPESEPHNLTFFPEFLDRVPAPAWWLIVIALIVVVLMLSL